MSLQEGLGQESLRQSLEARPDKGQVDAVDGHVVAGRALPRRLAAAVDGDGAWNVTNRDTVTVLLNLHFLQKNAIDYKIQSLGPKGSFI